MDIIISIFLAIRNAGIASSKGYGKWKYGLLTFFGFFVAEMLCIMLLLAYKYTGALDPKAIMGFLTEDVSRQVLILLCGMGADKVHTGKDAR